MEPSKERDGWLASFFSEVISMPRRHVLVFLVVTVLLVVVEVEVVEGWHLIHLVELVGVMVFLYLLWVACATQPHERVTRDETIETCLISSCGRKGTRVP